MLTYHLAEDAEMDLSDILSYVKEHNPCAATKLFTRFEAVFESLTHTPFIGSIRSEFHPQARCLVVGKYLVFYEVLESIVYILRILHSARDIPPTLSAKQ